jgi:predicted PurR-regulated permease PerM
MDLRRRGHRGRTQPDSTPEPGRENAPEPEQPAEQPDSGLAATPASGRLADEAAGSAEEPGPAAGKVGTPSTGVVPRWVQAVMLPLALIGAFELIRASGSVFVVFVAAAIIALIFNPSVKLLERWLPRGIAILCPYVVVTLIVAGLLAILAQPVANQIAHFANNLPHYTRAANHDLINTQSWLNRRGLHVHVARQGTSALDALASRIEKSSGTVVSVTSDVVTELVKIGADLILMLVLSIYLLVYAPSISRIVRRLLPDGDGTTKDDYPLLIQHAVVGYVQGQIAFSLVMGISVGIVLWVFGVTGLFPAGQHFALFFALFYALMELIPYLGPIIGPIPPLIVALATQPLSAIWLLIAFISLQQLEGHVVAPQIFRISLRINPILVILALLVGYELFGIVGALLALPVTAVIRQTALYLRRHLVLEQWLVRRPPRPPS